MKKLLWLLSAVVALSIPPVAQAHAGHWDKTFGRIGKVVDVLGSQGTPKEAGSFHIAPLPRGKFVVLTENTLVEYRSDGRRNRNFGTNGKVQVEAPAAAALKLVDVVVDSRGRILVAGTVGGASAFVARYLSQGQPDPRFGQNGTVVTSLGLPAPPPPPNKGLFPTPVTTEPVVKVLGLGVDENDRPILTGGWFSDYQFCYPSVSDTPKETGYVARLTVDGSIDRSFGGDGVVVPDPAEEIETSPIIGSGILSIGSLVNCLRASSSRPELTQVAQSGEVDKGFGSDGRVAVGYWTEPLLVQDRFNRILLLGPMSEGESWALQRRSPSGALDRRFGHRGEAKLTAVDSCNDALATDHRGRVVLAGSDGPLLLVDRRLRDGSIDRRFGDHGEVESLFPGELELSHHKILVGGGKILVGGTWVKGNRYGVAFARYLAQ